MICVKIRLFELISGHKEAKDAQVDIKLFEFDSSEELKSEEVSKPVEKHLAKPSIYLNI